MKRLARLGFFWALVCGGCLQSFDPASYVVELRLLGVKAEPPEVDGGASARLTAFVVDQTHGDAGAATVRWFLCNRKPAPGSGQDVDPDCFDADADADLIALGEGGSIDVTMPAVQNPFELGLPDATGGFYLPVLLRVERAGKVIDAVYKLRYHVPDRLLQLLGLPVQPPNDNPKLDQLLAVPDMDAGAPVVLDENGPMIFHPNWKYKLRATVADGSAESYKVLEGDPRDRMTREVTEIVSISWFTTAGVLSESVTGAEKPDTELRFDQRTPEPPAEVDLWLVARDQRGGTDFMRRRFTLSNP